MQFFFFPEGSVRAWHLVRGSKATIGKWLKKKNKEKKKIAYKHSCKSEALRKQLSVKKVLSNTLSQCAYANHTAQVRFEIESSAPECTP